MNPFTLATYNICHGKHPEHILENVLRLKAEGAGIICLQEVRKPADKPFLGDALKRRLGKSWRAHYLLGNHSPVPHRDLGLATYWDSSVFEEVFCDRVGLPGIESYHLGRQLLTLQRQSSERGALVLTFKFGENVFRVVNVHLDLYGGAAHRLRQIAHLAGYLRADEESKDILCGDLNTIGTSAWRATQREQARSLLGDDFMEVLPELGGSWRLGTLGRTGLVHGPARELTRFVGRWFQQRLDYIFCRGFGVTDARVLKCDGSDHLPLFARFLPLASAENSESKSRKSLERIGRVRV